MAKDLNGAVFLFSQELEEEIVFIPGLVWMDKMPGIYRSKLTGKLSLELVTGMDKVPGIFPSCQVSTCFMVLQKYKYRIQIEKYKNT